MTRTEMNRLELAERERHNRADERQKRIDNITNAISSGAQIASTALFGKAGIVGQAINAGSTAAKDQIAAANRRAAEAKKGGRR